MAYIAVDPGSLRFNPFPLPKHAYSDILKISTPKNGNFQIKNSDIFFIFLLKT